MSSAPAIREAMTVLQEQGYCVLKQHFARVLIDACRDAFWPRLLSYLAVHANQPNRGTHRYFLPMSFEPPCFTPELFFDAEVLSIVRGLMGESVVADQWGCDVALQGSDYQGIHVDYKRPLFTELPDLSLPVYMLVVSFGLGTITGRDVTSRLTQYVQHSSRSGATSWAVIDLTIGHT